jgi:hypothetical protein
VPPKPRGARSDSSVSPVLAEIEAAVANEVEKQLNREREIIKSAGSIGFKIIATSLAVLFAVLTVFSLTTWKDVKEQTVAIAKLRVDELVKQTDSDTGVKHILNDLLNHTIVAADITAAMRLEASNKRQITDLPRYEWDRLRDWLKDENIGDQEFLDVLGLLNAQSDVRKTKDANEFLSDMLNPANGSPYVWMLKHPDRQSAILSTFENKNLGKAAVTIALSTNFSEELRVDLHFRN